MPWADGLEVNSPAYVIASTPNARVRVVAGPGTGKSFAMKRRVARILEDGVDPRVILPVTFTNVAAEDLHRELVGMGVQGCEEIQGTTLHGLAFKILMRNHVLTATGRTPRPLNEYELKPMRCDLVRTGTRGQRGLKSVDALLSAYEAAWATLQTQQPGFAQSQEQVEFEADFLAFMYFHKSMLIGEVIPQLHQYLTSNPGAQERGEYSHILVDEYQDLNKAEQGVIDLLSTNADICIVGDDDQSIYSFKHAHPDGIREWITINTTADDVNLSDCRRCPTRVVEMANSLIAYNVNRPVPLPLLPMAQNGVGDVRIIQYGDIDAEVAGVTGIVSQMIQSGTPAGDILLLTQSRAYGTPIYESLVAANVPTKSYYAESELASEQAQEAFSILKLLADRDDRIALRWLIGRNSNNWYAAGYRRIRDHCEVHGLSPWDVMNQLESGVLTLQHTNGIIIAYREIVTRITDLEALPDVTTLIDTVFPNGIVEFRDIRTLAIKILTETPDIDIVSLVREVSALISKPEIPTEVQDVRIMSLHKSKGLSAPVTIIAGCVQGLLPRPLKSSSTFTPTQAQIASNLEEQRRLFYVGMTRVKAALPEKPGTLILTYSQQMPRATAAQAGITPAGNQYGISVLHASQFIRELGPQAPAPIAG